MMPRGKLFEFCLINEFSLSYVCYESIIVEWLFRLFLMYLKTIGSCRLILTFRCWRSSLVLQNLAKDISNSIERSLRFLWFDGNNFLGLVFGEPVKGQLVAEFHLFLLFSQLGVGTHDCVFQLGKVAIQGSGNSSVELLLGNSGKHAALGIGLGQGRRAVVSLEASAWVPDLLGLAANIEVENGKTIVSRNRGGSHLLLHLGHFLLASVLAAHLGRNVGLSLLHLHAGSVVEYDNLVRTRRQTAASEGRGRGGGGPGIDGAEGNGGGQNEEKGGRGIHGVVA
mmetsp:Transcript_6077/g.17266  ORF Transcript_6077/g.17266 Transcript_6077/m.17266 type:complete len:282 (-) Transcript_6077:132-977(-)